MCTKCKDDRCGGIYLFHSKELSDRFKIIKKELTENPNRKFILINSPSSGEIFTKFYELHALDNVSNNEAGLLVDRRYDKESVIDVKPLIDITDDKIDLLSNIESLNGNTVIISRTNACGCSKGRKTI